MAISYFFLKSHERAGEIYESETTAVIMELKKDFLKSTVDNLILQMEVDREIAKKHYEQHTRTRYHALSSLKGNLSREKYIESLCETFGLTAITTSWTVLIWDEDGKIIHTPDGDSDLSVVQAIEKIKPLLSCYEIIEHEGVSCLFGYTNAQIDRVVKSAAAAKIRSLQFDNESYIWVNEVLDYGGGKNYAIRLIHPNLPQTEGIYLSTDMTDSQGNFPYLDELEGVKEQGALFFSYHFKELGREETSEKLTYARLYKDFNWIIAMGVQNNQMEKHAAIANEKIAAANSISAVQLLIALIALVLSFVLLIILIENLRYRHSKRRMEQLISHDTLTLARSRSFGTNCLERAFHKFQSGAVQTGATLMVFDIDNFKRINDGYGHLEGDRVLQEVVKAVHQLMGVREDLFRFGGDEFVGIFYDMQEEGSLCLANQILRTISSLEYKVDETAIPLSISIGISSFRKDDATYADAIRRADKAMYVSKAEGGNKATVL